MKTHNQMFSAAMFIIALVLIASPAAALETSRVSVSTASVQSNNTSALPALNENGNFVAFDSSANNLVTGDTNFVGDVFVRNRQTGETTRVSVATGGGQGNSTSGVASLSGDGRFVAFVSVATNLVVGDTNGAGDIFVHDRQTGQTTRVSVATGGGQADDSSFSPALSADGRFVAFHSFATNLVVGDTNGVRDVFVHDRQTGQTTRVSVATGGTEGDGTSRAADISEDGRWVAFESIATNLVAGDTNGVNDVFVHDRQTGTTTRVSVPTGGAVQGNDHSLDPDISGDGRFVAFSSSASNLVSGDTNGDGDVFVHDRQTVTTVRVSVPTGGSPQSNDESLEPAISGDGRFVAFLSFATNLVPGGTSGNGDVFVHDTQTNTTTQMSVSTAGVKGNDFSCNPAISQDGRIVGFFSDSNNLVPGDTNGRRDIFSRDRTVLLDLDGDGKADIVWRDSSTTVVAGWLLNGATIVSSAFLGGVPAEWQIAGIGDVNGDGEADVIWLHTTGIAAIWFMNGVTITGVAFPGGAGVGWEVAGVGDVDGDGTADILWRNTSSGVVALWLMKGGAIANAGFLGGVPLEWLIAGLADVNGDGKADVVWSNGANFLVATWLMNGLTITGVTFPATLSAEWELLGSGDFNGDGTADLFWYNTTSGVVAVWAMSGGTIASSGNVAGFPLDVEIVQVADTNGDGKPDLVIRNTTTGLVSVSVATIGTLSTGVQLPTDWEAQN